MKTFAILNSKLEKSGSDFQVIPSGKFRAVDGRPICGAWEVKNPVELLNNIKNRKKPFVVDYEHQTLNAVQNGMPAPAAGKVSPLNFEWRESGLWALQPQWTEKAKDYLRNGEYSEISPVIYYDEETGEVLGLHSIALTNDPALHDLASVSLKRLLDLEENNVIDNEPDDRIQKVSILEQILEMLYLPKDSTDDVILKTLSDVLADKKRLESAVEETVAEPSNETMQVAANSLAMGSLTKKIESLTKQLEKRDAELKQRDVDDLIRANLTKLPTKDAQEKARKMDIGTLKQVLTMIPEQVALKSMQTDGKNLNEVKEKSALESYVERQFPQGGK